MEFNNEPLFSIIIPTYNHAQFIKKCLDSVIAQTFVNWEVIVVNNFSDDDTIKVVNSYTDGRIKIINFKNNGVIAASRNEGIRNAKGQWICFLDSDDWWYPNKLKSCLNHLASSDIIYHDVDYYNKNGRVRRKIVKTRHLEKNVFKDLLLGSNALPNSSVVVRKELLERVGFMSENPELIAVEDFDCWLRLAKVTDRFVYIAKSLGGYWIGASNISLSEKHLDRELKLFEIHSSSLSPELRIEARKRFCYRIGRMEQNMGHIDSAIDNYWQSTQCSKLITQLKSLYFLFLLWFKKSFILFVL
jgi:glycosyltransferase involved in cell wall biosynthesis